MENSEIANKLQICYQQIDSTVLYLKFSLNKPKEEEIDMGRDIVIIIDKSGSMSGGPIDKTKIIVGKLLDFIKINIKVKSITILSFDTNVDSLSLNIDENLSETIEKLKKFVGKINSGGGTIFSKALNSISDFIIRKEKIIYLSVIFLTDGLVCDNYDLKNDYFALNSSVDSLKKHIELYTDKCEFHTLGFSNNHDVRFLDKLAGFSKKTQGTYQYIEKVADLDLAFENISLMLNSYDSMNCQFISKMNEFKEIEMKLTFSFEENDSLVYENDVFITDYLDPNSLKKSYLKIELKEGKIIELVPSIITFIDKIDKISSFKIEIKNIYNTLQIMSKKIQSGKDKLNEMELNLMNDEFNSLKNKYYSKTKEYFQIPHTKRKLIGELMKSTLDYFNLVFQLINLAFKNQITNETIAKVTSLAYKDIINKKILKKLDQRTSTNVKMHNEMDQIIQDKVNGFKFDEIKEKYKNYISDIGDCFLSCNNFVEALQEGDCLCITFNVSRNEQTIMMPSTLVINELFPTIVSAKSFLDSVKFSMNISKNSSGGFSIDKKDASIVKGVANENINGCLPIFICSEHWEVGKLLIKPILGWTCTLDPMGYFQLIKEESCRICC